MLKQTMTALAVSAMLLAPQMANAAEQYKFDKAHTQVMFAVNHLGFSNSHGRFVDFDGGFTFDAENVENSKIDVIIHTNSIEMDDEKWNAHLKNADFLDIEKFPEMHFKSQKITKTSEKTGEVTGELTLLGITKPVTLNVTFNRAGVHPYSKKEVAGFSAMGEIKRSDFGMTYGLPGVGDTVKLMIEVEGIKENVEQSPITDKTAE